MLSKPIQNPKSYMCYKEPSMIYILKFWNIMTTYIPLHAHSILATSIELFLVFYTSKSLYMLFLMPESLFYFLFLIFLNFLNLLFFRSQISCLLLWKNISHSPNMHIFLFFYTSLTSRISHTESLIRLSCILFIHITLSNIYEITSVKILLIMIYILCYSLYLV
jgi:hypothetical protein